MTSLSPHQIQQYIVKNGFRIGDGKEADIFALNGFAWKVFASNAREESIQQNIDFLVTYSPTGVVPRFGGFAFLSPGLIKMELLTGMITVKAFQLTEEYKNIDCRNQLLEVVCQARSFLPSNIQFRDFHLSNIMIARNSKGWPTRAVFIEAGKMVEKTWNARTLFLDSFVSEINGRRCPAYQKYRLEWGRVR